MRARRLATQVLDHALGGGNADIRGDQRRFEVIPERGVERGSAKHFFEVGNIGLPAGFETLREAFPEALFFGRLRLSRHHPSAYAVRSATGISASCWRRTDTMREMPCSARVTPQSTS